MVAEVVIHIDFTTREVSFSNTEDVDTAGDVVVVESYARTRQPCGGLGEGFKDRDIVKGSMVDTDREVLWFIWDMGMTVREVHIIPLYVCI